ncbi:phosphatase PAP2 family protein [Hymenobacter sp. UYCo722]|uniref:phosphatase PAP2 family protein n=1 Tax=Hymenobacter sp. UYCo722 TaxID=3156335 RepID=UPI003391486C
MLISPPRPLAHAAPKPGLLRLALLVSVVIFAYLAVVVVRAGRLPWDAPILEYWHRHATPALDKVAVFFTIVGNTGPMVGLGLLVFAGLLARRQGRAAWVFFASVGGSMLLTQLIKPLVARPRPALWASIRPEHTFSFPSGHAMDTAAIATALVFLVWGCRRRGGVFLLAPLFSLAVGWARVYLGVHNPSDVLAGWAAAVAWVVAVQLLARRTSAPAQIGSEAR